MFVKEGEADQDFNREGVVSDNKGVGDVMGLPLEK